MKAITIVALIMMTGCGLIGEWETVAEEDVEGGEWFYHLADFHEDEFRYSMSNHVRTLIYPPGACEEGDKFGDPVDVGQKSSYRLDKDEARSWPVGLNSWDVCVTMTSNDPFHVEVERRPI